MKTKARYSVYICEYPRRLRGGNVVRYVRLKWHDERGKECLDHLGKRDD